VYLLIKMIASGQLVVLSLLVATTAMGMLATIAWLNRPRPGAFWLSVYATLIAIWGVLELAVVSSPAGDLSVWLWLLGSSVVGPAASPVWLLLILSYLGYERFSRRVKLAAAGGFALLNAALVTLHAWSNLYLQDVQVVDQLGLTTVVVTPGPGYIFTFTASYVFVFVGLALLARTALSGDRIWRSQAALLGVPQFVPILAGFVISAEMAPVGTYIVVLSMAVVASTYVYALRRVDLFELVPASERIGLRRAFDDLGDGIAIVSEGTVVMANDTAREYVPLDGDLEGRDADDVLQSLYDGSRGALPVTVEHGGRFYELTSATIGDGVGYTLQIRDVTEREERQQLEAINAELERKNERLDEFASVVSHDLRNPLDVAKGHVTFAATDRDDEHLDAANTALDRMETLIGDVLTLARQGQPIDETERVSLSPVSHRCWDLVDSGAATLQVESDLAFLADPDRFQQLLQNLFHNSVEHGSADAAVRVGALADGTGFYVADDGPGIPPGERETAFESGYSTADGGTGFGLAIVQEIVDAHGWSIRVTESEPGGARFEVTGVEVLDSV
jgi:signal transduction histidine kinase